MSPLLVPVAQLTSYLREVLDGDPFLEDIWVEGEVSNLFPARSGHVYFTLRGEDSQIKCALFRVHATRQFSLPASGDQVAAHGHVTLYESDGTIQLYVDIVQPAGLGLAALQLERLRQQLVAEGLFAAERKRPIPIPPRVIGVVTSPDGAVWHDIQNVLRRRYPMTEVVLSPATVQGEQAPVTIVAALEALQRDGRAEVIILARGGGSAEDLAAFNHELVVRAVFACRVPVVTGVGHETDWTLVDDVADLRAPTPSAAAEVCVPSVLEIMARLGDARGRLERSASLALDGAKAGLRQRQAHLTRLNPGRTIVPRQALVRSLATRATRSQRAALDAISGDVGLHVGLLRALDPAAVLNRGYAVLAEVATQRPITRAAEATPGQTFRADLADGSLLGRVEEIRGTVPMTVGTRR